MRPQGLAPFSPSTCNATATQLYDFSEYDFGQAGSCGGSGQSSLRNPGTSWPGHRSLSNSSASPAPAATASPRPQHWLAHTRFFEFRLQPSPLLRRQSLSDRCAERGAKGAGGGDESEQSTDHETDHNEVREGEGRVPGGGSDGESAPRRRWPAARIASRHFLLTGFAAGAGCHHHYRRKRWRGERCRSQFQSAHGRGRGSVGQSLCCRRGTTAWCGKSPTGSAR